MTLGTRIVVLKDGVIQQVDTPQNLYDKPANKFVAGFIGSPQMNLIDAKVVQVGNQVHVQFGNADITLPDEKGKVLVQKGYVGKEVCFGIRPEDIHDGDMSNYPGATLTATIRVYELLGAEVFLYFDINETSFTARVSPRTTARPGDILTLGLDLSRIHIFDKDSELVVLN